MSDNVDRIVGEVYELTPKELRELRNKLAGIETETGASLSIPTPSDVLNSDSRTMSERMEKK